MRVVLVIAWLFVGLSGLIYHLGPGAVHRALDRAGDSVAMADQAVDQGDWTRAVECFDDALATLPADRLRQARELQLEKAKAQMMAGQLPEARESLEALLNELVGENPQNHALINGTRAALASSQYYMTWLMRLEGFARDVWEPEIEAARQNYRILAAQAREDGNFFVAKRSDEDLEAAIRLGRLDLAELQGLPLPCQCQGCCSGRSRGTKKGLPKPNRGAGMNLPPTDGS